MLARLLLVAFATLAFAAPVLAQGIKVPGGNGQPQLFYVPPALSYRPPKLVLEPPQIRQPVIVDDCAPSKRDKTRPCLSEAPKRAQSREEGRGSVRQPGR